MVHFLMAGHKLFWKSIAEWCNADFCEVTEHWDSVEFYDRYRFFYEVLISAATEFLVATVPQVFLEDPHLLLQCLEPRSGAESLVLFLYHFGFPWLMLNQGTHRGGLNMSWIVAYPWFSIAKNRDYKETAVTAIAVKECVNPDLREALAAHQTLSTSGGSDVAIDRGVEILKDDIVRSGNVSSHTIEETVQKLNGLKVVKDKFLGALDRVRFRASEPAAVEEEDMFVEEKDVLVEKFREHLGRNWDEVCTSKTKLSSSGHSFRSVVTKLDKVDRDKKEQRDYIIDCIHANKYFASAAWQPMPHLPTTIFSRRARAE